MCWQQMTWLVEYMLAAKTPLVMLVACEHEKSHDENETMFTNKICKHSISFVQTMVL